MTSSLFMTSGVIHDVTSLRIHDVIRLRHCDVMNRVMTYSIVAMTPRRVRVTSDHCLTTDVVSYFFLYTLFHNGNGLGIDLKLMNI